eukprot:scaffold649585_cov33-Prasinocladus_malaysianus.AAC.2
MDDFTEEDSANVNQLATHVIDDLRIHSRVLSPEEVTAGSWRLPADMSQEYRDGLSLHWSFEELNSIMEPDLSGRGMHGIRGGIDNRLGGQLVYRFDQVLPITKPSPSQGVLQDVVQSLANTTMFVRPGNATKIPVFPEDPIPATNESDAFLA